MSDTPRALFATDLDGTLVDRHDTIEPGDREAIARAEREGVRVTIATGRLTSRTLPVAKALGLKSPLVCADGGVIVCGETERVLSRRHIGRREVETILETFVRHGLSSFVFTHAAIHGCARGKDLHGYVSGWAYDITTHGDILAADAWRSDPHATVMLVGIGPEHGARGAEDHLEGAAPELERLSFELAGRRVIRFVSRGVSKGAGLSEVARELGLGPESVGVVGDWHNDVPMFEWAGRAFAMSHAPDDVKAKATDVLGPPAPGRAIADALHAFLDDLP